mmetsp:Transcript_2504/g.6795  ORF Transcript_2504/g.6795 Transcript_2504/m.6795 type:complete len:321 (-) Transcript_2504:1266-2228(-)
MLAHVSESAPHQLALKSDSHPQTKTSTCSLPRANRNFALLLLIESGAFHFVYKARKVDVARVDLGWLRPSLHAIIRLRRIRFFCLHRGNRSVVSALRRRNVVSRCEPHRDSRVGGVHVVIGTANLRRRSHCASAIGHYRAGAASALGLHCDERHVALLRAVRAPARLRHHCRIHAASHALLVLHHCHALLLLLLLLLHALLLLHLRVHARHSLPSASAIPAAKLVLRDQSKLHVVHARAHGLPAAHHRSAAAAARLLHVGHLLLAHVHHRFHLPHSVVSGVLKHCALVHRVGVVHHHRVVADAALHHLRRGVRAASLRRA